LSAIYFEPSFNHDFLQPVSDPAWSPAGYGYGTTQNRGVQNVPLMSTVGIQYAVDQTGSRVPIGTVPVCSREVPGGTVPAGSWEVPAGNVLSGSRGVAAGTVPAGSRKFPAIVPPNSREVIASTLPSGYREVPDGTVPVGFGVPSFYQPFRSLATGQERDSKIADGAIPSRSGTSSVYQPSAAAYTSPYGPHPMGTSVPGGQPVVVSGSCCPLCGRQDYHVHADGGVANDSNIVVSGAAPAAVVSSTTLPVNVALGQSAFLAGCERLFIYLFIYLS